MNEKIDYLNQYIDSKNINYYNGPKSLFKYRPFDRFAFDMIENNYIYLCQAEKLDDETECVTTVELENLYELRTDGLKRQCVDLIVNMLKPYMLPDEFKMIKDKVYGIMRGNHTVYPNLMLEMFDEIQEMIPGIDISPFINWIVNIPEKLDGSEIGPQFERLISVAKNARKIVGVCSLCESNDVDDMWEKYADNDTGYCIEYDVSNYEIGHIFPVIYNDERQNNIVIQLVANFIGVLIQEMSYNQIKADKSQYLSLFLSKNKKWEYQREWRVLGDAGVKLTAPKIETIYLGKKVSEENELKMLKFSKIYGFEVKKRL